MPQHVSGASTAGGSHDLSRLPVKQLLEAAREMAAMTRELVCQRMASGFDVRVKSDKTFVTNVDLEVEKLLRAEIEKRFPDHGILGEEFAPRNAGADFQWILDPIDGTLSFTRGIPLFGTIVGVHYRGVPVAGFIDHPALGELYSAAAGLGAWRNGQRITLTDAADVADEIIACGDRHHFGKLGKQGAFDQLLVSHNMVRTYADCFGHTLAARGAVGAMVDYGLKIWDFSATQLLVEEAGGKFVIAQKKDGPEPIYGLIFGKPKVVDWLLPIFS